MSEVEIALGDFFGPLLLGPLFDTVGRVPMISATYIGSGALLFVTAWLDGDQGHGERKGLEEIATPLSAVRSARPA